jgi:hypothetical protein
MRSEYQLTGGRKNPYVDRLGTKGRADLLKWWSDATSNLRVLPDDVALEFPDTKTTVEALRLVIKLRALRSTRGEVGEDTPLARGNTGAVRARARPRASRTAKR